MRERAASDINGPEHRRRYGTNKDNDLRVCTWNIRNLYTPGAAQKLENILMQYKADITAIQEVRWIGNGIVRKKKCDIYYSCHKRLHVSGCGFIVGNRLRSKVVDFKTISDRLAVIRIQGRFYNISLICVYAPTDEAEDSTKEDFYDLLDRASNILDVRTFRGANIDSDHFLVAARFRA